MSVECHPYKTFSPVSRGFYFNTFNLPHPDPLPDACGHPQQGATTQQSFWGPNSIPVKSSIFLNKLDPCSSRSSNPQSPNMVPAQLAFAFSVGSCSTANCIPST